MCGICGTYGINGVPAERSTIEAMSASQEHRGPDERGLHLEGPVGLGHARLSVLDLKTGAQPISNEDKRLWITFNGEVFNYIELRNLLKQRGHRFRTESDTEVIVHGYEEFGTDFFAMMNGQWAVALWDGRRQELLLCRDRVGICPLYYAYDGTKVVFASEVRALWCDPSVPRELDLRGLAETLTFWTTVAPQTMYKGVRELPPGHWICFGPTTVTEGTYWRLCFPPNDYDDAGTADKYAAELREILLEATRLRFTRSDVPVAAYLSGGIDSSVTAALIQNFTNSELKTFSLRFGDEEFDEGGFQEQMVRRLGTDHTAITVNHRDIAEAFPLVVRHAEKPLLRTAAAPMFLLSKLVHDSGFKVVVTGEGSDEMLGGYDIFREAVVRAFIARHPHSGRRKEIIQSLYPWLQRNPTAAPAFARRFFSQALDGKDLALSHRPRWQSAAAISRMLNEEVRHELEQYDVAEEFIDRMPSDARSWHPLSRAQWIEAGTLLSGYLLSSQGDRMLMAHGVEGRFPFLDPQLIDKAAMLPPRYKVMGLDEKFLLKHAFKDLLPPEILRRPKQPYRAPDAASFFSSPVDWVDDVTSAEALKSSGLFNPQAVEHLTAKCRRRKGQGMSNSDNMAVTAVLSTLLLQRQMESRE